MMLAVRISALLIALLVFTSHAHAQACAGGRVDSAATQGRCCWPGQSWDVERAVCAGPPVCPPGLVGHGDECIATLAPPAPSGVPTPSGAPPGAEVVWLARYEPPADGWLDVPGRPPGTAVVRGWTRVPNAAPIATGALLLAAGYGNAIAFAVSDLQASNPREGAECRNWAGGASLVPILGSWMSLLIRGTCSYTGYSGETRTGDVNELLIAWRTAEAILQGVGLTMIVAGIVWGRRVIDVDRGVTLGIGPMGLHFDIEL